MEPLKIGLPIIFLIIDLMMEREPISKTCVLTKNVETINVC
jgi:hypothetical protein